MRGVNLFKQASPLEIATYGHAVRTALRLGGLLAGGRGPVGIVLPPDADHGAYKAALEAVLEEAGLSKIYGVAEAYVSRRGTIDFEEVSTMLKRMSTVLALFPHDAAIPPEIDLALDKIIAVGAVTADHAAAAVKSVLDVVLSADQVERLMRHPPKLWLQALRPGRNIEDVLAKLAGAAAKPPRGARWEPRVEELAGFGEATTWALDLSADIADWRAGRIAWKDVDRGVLLSGPPGTGKTMFASAVARTCSANFTSASIAEWQAKGHLGDMLAAMHRTFREAISAAPSVLFLDELDAIGDRRSFEGRNAAYENQVVNALLGQLDGTGSREGVVVIAATNYVEKIDPALRRAGRLDKHIEIALPDRKARGKILQLHFGVPLSDEELRTAAIATSGLSGADLEQLARTARRSARKEGRAPAFQDLLPLLPGDLSLTAEERRKFCVHEAGHALVGLELEIGSIDAIVVARQAGPNEYSFGHVSWKRNRRRTRSSQSYLDEIAMILGGMAAERVFYDDQYDGCGGSHGSDLHRASDIATCMLASLGMGALCYRAADTEGDLEKLRCKDPDLRTRIDQVLTGQLGRAEAIIRRRRFEIENLVKALEEREVVNGGEVDMVMSG